MTLQTTCFAPTEAHDLKAPQAYRLGRRTTDPGTIRVLCAGCVTRLREMGMDWYPVDGNAGDQRSRADYDDELGYWRERTA